MSFKPVTIVDATGQPIQLRATVFWITVGGRLAWETYASASVRMVDFTVESLHADGTISPGSDPNFRVPAGQVYLTMRDAMVAYKEAYENHHAVHVRDRAKIKPQPAMAGIPLDKIA